MEARATQMRSTGRKAAFPTGKRVHGGNDLAGIAVHIGARVDSMAGANEGWVSSLCALEGAGRVLIVDLARL